MFIQTDKAVYKPGYKILFRAIALNSQLKPAAEVRNELLNIYISVSSKLNFYFVLRNFIAGWARK